MSLNVVGLLTVLWKPLCLLYSSFSDCLIDFQRVANKQTSKWLCVQNTLLSPASWNIISKVVGKSRAFLSLSEISKLTLEAHEIVSISHKFALRGGWNVISKVNSNDVKRLLRREQNQAARKISPPSSRKAHTHTHIKKDRKNRRSPR